MTKYIKILLLASALAIVVIFIGIDKASAQQPPVKAFMRVSPVILNLSLVPKKQYNYTITVENLLDTPLPLRTTLEDFQTQDEEGGYILNSTHASPLLSWVSFDKKELIIPPHAKETVALRITMPPKIQIGGYYGIVFFEPVLSKATTQIPLSSKVGVLMLANIGVPSNNSVKGEIVQFKLDKFLYQKGPISYLLRFKNTELLFYSAKPFLTLKPLFGKEQKFYLEEKFVFPGKTRRWESSVELPNYWHGLYKATLAVSTGQGKQIIKETYLMAFPIAFAVGITFLLLVIIFIFKRRKRFSKVMKVLFTNSSRE